VAIGKTAYGRGLFATKFFAAGEVLYHGHSVFVGVKPGTIALKTDTGFYALDVQMHTVAHDDERRQVFLFDGFMNHSCLPNSYSGNDRLTEAGALYDTVASRDIFPNDEITCDYDLFEWDNRDKGIDKCGCGHAVCRGKAHGFQFLPRNLAINLLGQAYSPTIDHWLAANPRTLLIKTAVWAGLCAKKDGGNGWNLSTTRPFTSGELMMIGRIQEFNSTQFDELILACDTRELAPEEKAEGPREPDATYRPSIITRILPFNHACIRDDGNDQKRIIPVFALMLDGVPTNAQVLELNNEKGTRTYEVRALADIPAAQSVAASSVL
jgi:hypothetical protein